MWQTADLAIVNAAIREATDRVVLQPAPGGGVRDAWEREPSLSAPLWPVALDAWTILTEGSLERLHECPGDDCGWLFWDSRGPGRAAGATCAPAATAPRPATTTPKRAAEVTYGSVGYWLVGGAWLAGDGSGVRCCTGRS